MKNTKNLKGFTLVELLVVVVIIGILAAIALPNFIGAQAKAKNASVKGNMRTIQIASESYATDAGGAYSSASSGTGSIANYLPGGSNSLTGSAGVVPMNPMSGSTSSIAVTAITNVQSGRTTAPSSGPGGTGNLGYNNLSTNTSYAVTGSDTNGKQIGNGTGTLILSNQ